MRWILKWLDNHVATSQLEEIDQAVGAESHPSFTPAIYTELKMHLKQQIIYNTPRTFS